jgi:predicted GIY-YIG superfamily endonuclease
MAKSMQLKVKPLILVVACFLIAAGLVAGCTFCAVHAGATTLVQRRTLTDAWTNTDVAKSTSTRRFGQLLEVVVTKQVTDMVAARSLERKLKSKTNPQLAINVLSRQWL